MRIGRRHLLIAFAFAAAAAAKARATDYTWNVAGDGAWTWNGNWSPATGQPLNSPDTATIANPDGGAVPVTVTLSQASRSVGALTIAANPQGDPNQLVVGTNGELRLFGDVQNDGIIRVLDGSIVTFERTIDFAGGGIVELGGPGTTHYGTINAFNSGVINESAHTIEGNGGISGFVDNRGLIQAAAGTGFSIGYSSGGTPSVVSRNSGTLRAPAGGLFGILNDAIDNSGGLIEAAGVGAQVILDGANISGGTLRSRDGGAVLWASRYFGPSTLDGVTFEGTGTVQAGTQLRLHGTVVNNGAITTLTDGLAYYYAVSILDGDATLTGSGRVTLTGSTGHGGLSSVATGILTNDVGHRIDGSGDIVPYGLINRGQIVANRANSTMRIGGVSAANVDGLGDGVQNLGTLRAETGATLSIVAKDLRNDGLIVADGVGASVVVNCAIHGGTLRALNGAAIVVGDPATTPMAPEFDDVTLYGNATKGIGPSLALVHTLTNNGVLTIKNNGRLGGSTPDLALAGDVTIGGNGTVLLGTDPPTPGGPNVGWQSPTARVSTLTIGPDQTVSGRGNLGSGQIGLTNNGTIAATSSAAALVIGITSAPLINNGTLRATGAAGMQLLALDGRFSSASTLQIDAGSKLTVQSMSNVTFAPGSTLTQIGTFTVQSGARLTNDSTISPGTTGSYNIIKLDGTFTNAADGTLVMDLGGTTPGTQFDQLAGAGAAVADGTLDLRLRDGFNPALYSTPLDLIQDTSGADLAGTFARVLNVGTASDRRLAVMYGPAGGSGYSDVYVVAAVPGDADANAVVDFADLLALAKSYGSAASTSWQTGDFDGDGRTDFSDLLTLAKNYRYGTTSGDASALMSSLDPASSLDLAFAQDWALAQSLAPEPGAALLALLAGMSLVRRRVDRR